MTSSYQRTGTPFATEVADRIDTVGEVPLIRNIRNWLGTATPASPQGIGDDCAVWPQPPQGQQLLFTVDAVVSGRHFEPDCPPELVAAKLLKRNLSDIAAMGGTPHSALLALTLAPNQSLAWLERFFHGLQRCALEYATPVTGGDVTAGTDNFFAAHITLIGHAKRPLLRQGAQAGDHLFVTGALGGSICGHHLHFRPRLEAGQWLAGQADVRSMIDISDGLAKDLPELLPEGTAALLYPEKIPLSAAARNNNMVGNSNLTGSKTAGSNLTGSKTTGSSVTNSKAAGNENAQPPAWQHAFTDGEDHELLFTVAGTTDPREFIHRWSEHFGADALADPDWPETAFPSEAREYPPLRLAYIGQIADKEQISEGIPATIDTGRAQDATANKAAAEAASPLFYNADTSQPLNLQGGGFQHLNSESAT